MASANRYAQIIHARQAYNEGMTRATRHCIFAANSCIACRSADGEVISIYRVMNGNAMHQDCQCTFSFSRVYAGYQPVEPEPPIPDPSIYEPYPEYEPYPVYEQLPITPPGEGIITPVELPLEDLLKDLFPEDLEIISPGEPPSPPEWTCCIYQYAGYGVY